MAKVFEAARYTHCSFCDKPRADVRWLIAGGLKTVHVPGVNADYAAAICEECTDLAREIIQEERAKAAAKHERMEMKVERPDLEKPGEYRQVRLVELREGEEIIRTAGQNLPAEGMIPV